VAPYFLRQGSEYLEVACLTGICRAEQQDICSRSRQVDQDHREHLSNKRQDQIEETIGKYEHDTEGIQTKNTYTKSIVGTLIRYCSLECARASRGNAANDQCSTSTPTENTRFVAGDVILQCKILTCMQVRSL